MKNMVRSLAVVALIATSLTHAMTDPSKPASTGTGGKKGGGIGNVSVDVKVQVCTAVGGSATYTPTTSFTGEASTAVSGGDAACGDQVIAVTQNGALEGEATKATKPTSTRRSRRAALGAIGDISQITQAQYATLSNNAQNISTWGITDTFPAVNQTKMYVISTTGKELFLKNTKSSATKYKLTFYMRSANQVSTRMVELFEIANIEIGGLTATNLKDTMFALQAGADGTVGFRFLNMEQLLPTNVPQQNFAQFRGTMPAEEVIVAEETMTLAR